MKNFTLTFTFLEWTSQATKQFEDASDALKWALLCIDICGKDEAGRKFKEAILVNDKGEYVAKWGVKGLELDNNHVSLFIESDGKFYKVTALANSDREVNEYLKCHAGEGLASTDRTTGVHIIAESKETKPIK